MPKTQNLFRGVLIKYPAFFGPVASLTCRPLDALWLTILTAHVRHRGRKISKSVRYCHTRGGFVLSLKAGGASSQEYIPLCELESGDKSLQVIVSERFDSMARIMVMHAGPYI